MNNLISPLEVPWMISPSVSSIEVRVVENGDCYIEADVAFLSNDEDPFLDLSVGRIKLTFRGAQWVRFHPAHSDDQVLPPDVFHSVGEFDVYQDDFIARFRRSWASHLVCPAPRFHRVENSDWLAMTGASHFGCVHYVIEGHDAWVELLSREWSWKWLDSASSSVILTND